jgi:excinuclease ABC subunit A
MLHNNINNLVNRLFLQKLIRVEDARKLRFSRARVNGEMLQINDEIVLEKNNKHTIEIITGRVIIEHKNKKRIVEAFEKALEMSEGNAVALMNMKHSDEPADTGSNIEKSFSLHYAYKNSTLSVPELEPQLFSFNSPIGSCPHCIGIGYTTGFFRPFFKRGM